MKMHNFFALLLVASFTLIFSSCTKQQDLVDLSDDSNVAYFSKEDISNIKGWMSSQRSLDQGYTAETTFPELSFSPKKSSSDQEVIQWYMNGIMYLNDDIINGQDLDFENIRSLIKADEALDDNAKEFLYSSIQLSQEIFTSKEVIEEYSEKGNQSNSSRAVCNCDNAYNSYITYYIQCQAYGNVWGHCTAANNAWNLYVSCLAQTNHCPTGFIFDSANCYSGIHFPSGYNGFIWGNGFYTQRNCSISTANNCCPNGYGFDGANCHYWGVYFPSDYQPFIWNNTFYVVSKCY